MTQEGSLRVAMVVHVQGCRERHRQIRVAHILRPDSDRECGKQGALVVDLADPECAEHVLAIRERLEERRITLAEAWPHPLDPGVVGEVRAAAGSPASAGKASPGGSGEETDEIPDPFRLVLPTLLLANKCGTLRRLRVSTRPPPMLHSALR